MLLSVDVAAVVVVGNAIDVQNITCASFMVKIIFTHNFITSIIIIIITIIIINNNYNY